MALRRSARRLIGTASRSTNACSPASKDIATPSRKLRPTRARATARFRGATASAGPGFSFASDYKSVDILGSINTLNRIVQIHPRTAGCVKSEDSQARVQTEGAGNRSMTLRFPFNAMPQQKKGFFMFKLTLVVMLAALFGNGTAFARENRGTPEQRAACAPDAFRLCLSYIPDATNVEACLRQRKSDLSDACRAVFDHAAGTASVRTIGSLRSRGARDEE